VDVQWQKLGFIIHIKRIVSETPQTNLITIYHCHNPIKLKILHENTQQNIDYMRQQNTHKEARQQE
jgi:hypothetical protein